MGWGGKVLLNQFRETTVVVGYSALGRKKNHPSKEEGMESG